jgi:hypothetical protein
LNGQRLVVAIDRRAQDRELIRVVGDDRVFLLGVREVRPQYHQQKRQHERAAGYAHKVPPDRRLFEQAGGHPCNTCQAAYFQLLTGYNKVSNRSRLFIFEPLATVLMVN